MQVLATSKRFLKHAICLADVKLGEKIGEGSFGEVYKGTLYGQEIALKKMRVTQDALKEFKKEVRIMTSVCCTQCAARGLAAPFAHSSPQQAASSEHC